MKNNYLLPAGLLALSLTIAGCSSSVAKLAVDTKEITTIDATTKIDPKDYLKDIAEDADVTYEIKDNVMTITVSKDDKTETFEVPVEIEEPNVSIDDDITIDTYVGYDIEDYIHEDEGVTHTTNFNEETGELSVTFSKGEWTTTLDSNVEVTSSDPVFGKYEVVTSIASFVGTNEYYLILYSDGTCDDGYQTGTWSTDGKTNTASTCGLYSDYALTGTISDDGKTVTFYDPNNGYTDINSSAVGMTTTWTKVED